jgi:hypothetical protein
VPLCSKLMTTKGVARLMIADCDRTTLREAIELAYLNGQYREKGIRGGWREAERWTEL